MLVFGDLGDGAHGAFLDAFTAADAGFLVHRFGYATRNLENFLRARVDANSAPDAFIGVDYRMSHDDPFLI